MTSNAIAQVESGHDLQFEEMAVCIGEIMQGHWSEDQIARLLMAINAKGPAVDEVAGAAHAMRQNMTRIHTHHTQFIDTCGTGGDGSGTFNISTAAALVIAASGVPVAKHGNRSVTSKSGSADVLSVLGVNINATVEQVENCLNEVGICFCFAPLMHGSMRHVAAVRKSLGVPTIFNLLGPLCNPAGAPFQLMGVGKPELRQLMAAALAKLGTNRSVLVTGRDGMDEVTLQDATEVTLVSSDGLEQLEWTPEDFGVKRTSSDSLIVDGPVASADKIRRVLEGEQGAAQDIVVLNSAAALWTIGAEKDLRSCADRALAAIQSGAARDILVHLAALSHK
ncbi:MAG: anthranilate phosphoribosyltransferase [Pirellulaceae bacterium]